MMYLKRKENKMDFTQFVNSKDIRKHLQDIGYEFNALEAAWLVYQCKNATLEEKHEAWRYIIHNMPDTEIQEDIGGDKYHSLHHLLWDYMKMQNVWIEEFCENKSNAVYKFEAYFTAANQWGRTRGAYTTYDSCVNTALSETGDNVSEILIFKEYLDTPSTSHTSIILRNDGSIMSVERWNIDMNHAHWILSTFFDDLWFSFPIPFEKGDILYDITQPEAKYDYCIGPFVMTDIAPTNHNQTEWLGHDSTDMNAWGYFQYQTKGEIYHETMWNYMDLEYYPEEKLTGKRRVLKALSNHIKGEIDDALFARAYHQILCEEYAEEMIPRSYTMEGLSLAGIDK